MSPAANDCEVNVNRLERNQAGRDGGPLGALTWPMSVPTLVKVRRVVGLLVPTMVDVSHFAGRDHGKRVHQGHLNSNERSRHPQQHTWRGARCLVTGASSGLGRAIAEHLVRAGAHVVLTGRSVERLQSVASRLIDEGSDPAKIIPIPADLTVYEDRERLFARVAEHCKVLDLVVNNAGVGAAGMFDTHDPDVLRTVFEINVFALAEVCRASLPLLARGHRPALVNMGSIVARRGLPGRTEYSASKFAVTGFTEALRLEWRRFGIHVLQVNPGFINTPFDQHAVVNTARYSVAHLRTMSADAVAAAIVLTWQGKLLLAVNAIAPRFVDWGFARWLFRYYPKAPVPRSCNPAEKASYQ
jgi:short-subunit dehydrogenase